MYECQVPNWPYFQTEKMSGLGMKIFVELVPLLQFVFLYLLNVYLKNV